MTMKWITICLVAVAMLGYTCHGQSKPGQKVIPPEPAFNWEYPKDPEPPNEPDVSVDVIAPIITPPAVQCLESQVQIILSRNMFGSDHLINSADIKMGGCSVSQEIPTDLLFQYDLQSCGSQVSMSDDWLIYTFKVTYSPSSANSVSIVRSGRVDMTVQCHYKRKHHVSSLGLIPRWIPFSEVRVAEQLIDFSLSLMTSDGLNRRRNINYLQTDMIRMRAQVYVYNHVPLRVYVDKCVATLKPDVNSSPNYVFINNYGCMIDGQATGSQSTFFPRGVESELQFQLQAFMFKAIGQDIKTDIKTDTKTDTKTDQTTNSMNMYITCNLKASTTARVIDSTYKACSYANGWVESNGYHGACSCCSSVCGVRNVREVPKEEEIVWEATTSIAINVAM